MSWGAGAVTAVSIVVMAGQGLASAATGPGLAALADQSVWSTNGRVMDIRVVGTRAVLGGDFDYIGPTTGHTAFVSATTGLRVGSPLLANLDVRATVSDGAGGYYIGGDFGFVAGVSRSSVAHVTSTGAFDPTFKPLVKGSVNALALVGSNLILGGSFTSVNGSVTQNLAAVDRTGTLVPGWTGSTNAAVNALVPTGSSVFVGGQFSTVSGLPQQGVARISGTTGALDSTFTGQTAGTVRALALTANGSTLYAGGDFTAASSVGASASVTRLAAFGAATGTVVPGFKPIANASVFALAVDPTSGNLYVGGAFTSLAGGARATLGAVTPAGALSPFNAALAGCHLPHTTGEAYGLVPCSTTTNALAVNNGTLYVGGNFVTSGTTTRHDAAAFSLATGALGAWDPVPGATVLTIAPMAYGLVLGGSFSSTGGLVRKGLAAIDLTTGQGDPAFKADVNGLVVDLEPNVDGSALYVGGDFTTVGGLARSMIALVNATTGAVAPAFAPTFNNDVIVMTRSGNSLYVGGKFITVGTTRIEHAVKLNATTGAIDPTWKANAWGPSGTLRANGMVQGLQVSPDGATVYLAGPFTTINGASVAGGLAVVSGSTGALLPKQLGGVQTCGGANGPWINHITLSADGSRLYGGDICPDYIYQWDTINRSTASNPTGLNWRMWCDGGMQGMLEVNGHFYYGTHGKVCSNRWGGPSLPRVRFAAFDQTTGALLDYAPEFDSPMGVWSFAASPQGLLVGGDFTFAGSRSNIQQGFALFRGTP